MFDIVLTDSKGSLFFSARNRFYESFPGTVRIRRGRKIEMGSEMEVTLAKHTNTQLFVEGNAMLLGNCLQQVMKKQRLKVAFVSPNILADVWPTFQFDRTMRA